MSSRDQVIVSQNQEVTQLALDLLILASVESPASPMLLIALFKSSSANSPIPIQSGQTSQKDAAEVAAGAEPWTKIGLQIDCCFLNFILFALSSPRTCGIYSIEFICSTALHISCIFW
jgi:hypothetical protein